jgi:2-keto-3-deoxy-L-rhamnonate aldolase RhmA
MGRPRFVVGVSVLALLALAWPAAQEGGRGGGAQVQAPAGEGQAARGGRRGGGGRVSPDWQYGVVDPLQPDARGWGWQTKSYASADAKRPFYNIAKEALFNDEQITGITLSSFDPDLYCEAAKHYDYVWFEMQHSTMSFDEVRRMIVQCPRAGAAPFIRMPDALEANMQKATDLGALGIIVPTVDDALEARDAARFARFPPVGRRSSGGGAAASVWNQPGVNYASTINDNILVVVMIESLEGVANANEIASTFGVDLVICGNNDLSHFSGWQQTDPRYQDAITTVHNAALKAGKYYGNTGQQYATGHRLSDSIRFVQDGPSNDGWSPRDRGRGAATEEPVIGLPGAEAPAGRGGR